MIEELITTQREIINSQNEYIVLLKEHNESNENIISYKESFMEDATSTLNIVMEYADGGDLLQKIQKCKQSRT